MRKMLTLGLAIASLAASGSFAGAATAAAEPEVRPDTVVHVQGPPWANCRRWDSRTLVCRDPGWRGRNWRAWYGRRACGPGRRWWIDRWGRWRRC